ncbi:MAG TPA: diguanylate cyclase [Bryobacteraceae bacterium]
MPKANQISQDKPFRLLIADDSLVSRHLLDSTLKKWGYNVRTVADGTAAWNEFQTDDPPDLAILDWVMPGLTGPEVCRLVRQQEREKYTYLILLTSKSLKEDLIEGMESGADDYVTKPFDQHELQVRLRAGIRILELQAELVAAREALRDQATRDPLTKLWNRRHILEVLDRELARIQRHDTSLGLIMLDLDHFKSINDTHGHLAGDEVLRETARRLRAAVRQYDSIGRYGGEEFLIVMPGCGGGDIEKQAERLRLSLCQSPMRVGDLELVVTGSFGATFSLPAYQANQQDLVKVADEALYRAKRGGRNRVHTIRHEMILA